MPKRVDFFRLPRPVQERFAAATRRTAPPAPLLYRPAPKTAVWVCLGASTVLVVAAALLLRAGWGDVASPRGLHGTNMIAIDVALLALAAYGVVHAMALVRALDALPYKAGTYLFPACLVEARGPVLHVWPVGDAEAVEKVTTPPGLALRMPGGSRVVVAASNVAEVERADAALATLRPQLARALAEEDPHALAEMDPLHGSALSSPIGPKESMKRILPVWLRIDFAIAAGIGVVLGLGLAETRNSMSDEEMFRTVVAAATVPMYEQYLVRGGKHSVEVREVLLPRAQLAEADAQGTEAVLAFAAAHASSKIAAEIDVVVHRAMVAELEDAKKAGTVASLDQFMHDFPNSKLDAQLQAARHALYAKALAAWKAKAQADAQTGAFMEHLLAFAEKNGAACEVRFRLRPSKSLADADRGAMKSGHYPGPDALPSRYVSADAMRPREERVTGVLVAGFAEAFPADVLAARAGPPLDADAPAPSGVPTLLVEYSPEWSHGDTVSLRPATVFSGFNFTFDASFLLPDSTPPLKATVKAWRGAEPWKIKDDGLSREEFEQKVYDAMLDGAFDQLEKRLKDLLF